MTFSEDDFDGEYPSPKENETYKQYRERVSELVKKVFI